MKNTYTDEYEIIPHGSIPFLNLFLADIRYRTPHLHKDLEICLVLKNPIRIRTKEKERTLKPGSLFLFHPNELHELECPDSRCTLMSIQITPSFCSAYFPDFKNIIFDETICPPEDCGSHLMPLCISLATSYFQQEEGFSLSCMGKINELIYSLLHLLPHHFSKDEHLDGEYQKGYRLSRILEYIEETYSQKISLSELAKREGLSVPYLSRFIRENLNMSFQEYVNALRLKKATELLLHTSLPLIDICMESGFSDRKYFNRMFRQKYEISPKEYRNIHCDRSDFSFAEINQQSQTVRKSPFAISQRIYTPEESLTVLHYHT